jgi:molybdopterin molybdotransferase
MQTYNNALIILAEAVQPLATETVDVNAALGRMAAADIRAPIAVPPFDNSAMDGFAVRSEDTQGAAADAPASLDVVGHSIAGASIKSDAGHAQGNAWEIMTGTQIPNGFDSVVPVEKVVVTARSGGQPTTIALAEPVDIGRNLRRAGEDFLADDLIAVRGSAINAAHLMACGATGIQAINAVRQARIGVIRTGNELQQQNGELTPGMIFDANGPFLSAAIASLNVIDAGTYACSDDPEQFSSLINEMRTTTDIILTTGGVSAGRMDFVPSALETAGADTLFHKVSIRPGKPLLLAKVSDGPLVFGLPGNPIAAAVGFRFFVVPALRMMQGLTPEIYSVAALTNSLRKKPGMAFFAKARAVINANGQLNVTTLPGQESFKIKPMTEANCWIVADTDAEELEQGEPVRIAPLFPGRAFD